MRGLFEISLRKGWPVMAARILALCKAVDHQQWSFEHPLKQFGRLPQDVVTKLIEKKLTLDQLRDMSANDIGRL